MSVNPLRGEAALIAGDGTYTLTFDVNAFCLAEKALGMTTDAIVAALIPDKGGVPPRSDLDFLRAVIWAGLQRQHDCSVAEAGDIIADAGVPASRAALIEALAAAFGVTTEGEDRQHPPMAQRGTGSRSSRGGARPGKA